MKKEHLPTFFDDYLTGVGTIYGAVPKNDQFVFDEVKQFKELDLSYLRTIIPIKKLFFPKKQTIFQYNLTNTAQIHGAMQQVELEVMEPKILFGLHPCEISALNIQDEFFLDGKYKDPYYASLRERTVVIGLSCMPDEHCYCNTTGTSEVNKGFDLFFNELEDEYIVWVGSSIGDDIILDNQDIFEADVTLEDHKAYRDWMKKRNTMFQHNFEQDYQHMPKLMELKYDDEFWNELGEECLSCGQCTAICPTCSCFNVVDTLEVQNIGVGAREREWDSCMYPEYSAVAGGVDFRSSRASRLKLYYTHKLDSYKGEINYPACVGCGRCSTMCPVDINVPRVVGKLTEDL